MLIFNKIELRENLSIFILNFKFKLLLSRMTFRLLQKLGRRTYLISVEPKYNALGIVKKVFLYALLLHLYMAQFIAHTRDTST